ncbi:bone marrow proteoglycan [Pelecanus crispus]|uniref:bone marrow proteoglycan n=1 Tax=Pelecanus crispus TaxID=36300 RepID=UPI003F5D4477
MQPCLLLALALLGTAWVPEEEETQCPLESETQTFSLSHPLGAKTCHYVVVSRCLNFYAAQHICAHCYRGSLVSIHSHGTNAVLQRQARARTNSGQVWIGAITTPWHNIVHCHWMDRSRWNYSHWLRGNPRCSHRFCTSLCTNNGRWRSQSCQKRLPFICEY